MSSTCAWCAQCCSVLLVTWSTEPWDQLVVPCGTWCWKAVFWSVELTWQRGNSEEGAGGSSWWWRRYSSGIWSRIRSSRSRSGSRWGCTCSGCSGCCSERLIRSTVADSDDSTDVTAASTWVTVSRRNDNFRRAEPCVRQHFPYEWQVSLVITTQVFQVYGVIIIDGNSAPVWSDITILVEYLPCLIYFYVFVIVKTQFVAFLRPVSCGSAIPLQLQVLGTPEHGTEQWPYNFLHMTIPLHNISLTFLICPSSMEPTFYVKTDMS